MKNKTVYYKFKLDGKYMEVDWVARQKLLPRRDEKTKEYELTMDDVWWVESIHYGVGFSTLQQLKNSGEYRLLKQNDIPFNIVKQTQVTTTTERELKP